MAVAAEVDAKVDALRAQLPVVQTTGYFNTGSNGPIPIVAYEAADATARRELNQGRIVPGVLVENRERNRRFAAMAAAIFGADDDEIALTHSASEGLATARPGWSRRWPTGSPPARESSPSRTSSGRRVPSFLSATSVSSPGSMS